MGEIELKECPFCACDRAEIIGGIVFWVECPDCGAQTDVFDIPEEAAEAWNRRANETWEKSN